MVVEVIACHGGEHDIAQPHRLHGVGHPGSLAGIDRHRRLPFLDLTEGTAAGADRSAQKKRGGAGGVALTAIGTTTLLADRVQSVLLHQALNPLQV